MKLIVRSQSKVFTIPDDSHDPDFLSEASDWYLTRGRHLASTPIDSDSVLREMLKSTKGTNSVRLYVVVLFSERAYPICNTVPVGIVSYPAFIPRYGIQK